MLLRTSSCPILNSWLPPRSSVDSFPSSPDTTASASSYKLSRNKSIPLLTMSCNSVASFLADDGPLPPPQPQTLSCCFTIMTSVCRSDPLPIRRARSETADLADEAVDSSYRMQRLFSSSGLDEEAAELGGLWTLGGGCAYGVGGGRACCAGSGARRSDGGHKHRGTEAYYEKMIQANPGNALLLGNYAKFLEEVREDIAKATEYRGREILANPNDGKVLSMYGNIIWQTKRDMERADYYYDQAVKAAPDDCYVMASYAKFLWDTEEEEDDENDKVEDEQEEINEARSTWKLGSWCLVNRSSA